jgi:hypothetical protein
MGLLEEPSVHRALPVLELVVVEEQSYLALGAFRAVGPVHQVAPGLLTQVARRAKAAMATDEWCS